MMAAASFAFSSKIRCELIGSLLSIDCGDKCVYQGFVVEIDCVAQSFALDRPLYNGIPSGLSRLHLISADIVGFKVVKSANVAVVPGKSSSHCGIHESWPKAHHAKKGRGRFRRSRSTSTDRSSSVESTPRRSSRSRCRSPVRSRHKRHDSRKHRKHVRSRSRSSHSDSAKKGRGRFRRYRSTSSDFSRSSRCRSPVQSRHKRHDDSRKCRKRDVRSRSRSLRRSYASRRRRFARSSSRSRSRSRSSSYSSQSSNSDKTHKKHKKKHRKDEDSHHRHLQTKSDCRKRTSSPVRSQPDVTPSSNLQPVCLVPVSNEDASNLLNTSGVPPVDASFCNYDVDNMVPVSNPSLLGQDVPVSHECLDSGFGHTSRVSNNGGSPERNRGLADLPLPCIPDGPDLRSAVADSAVRGPTSHRAAGKRVKQMEKVKQKKDGGSSTSRHLSSTRSNAMSEVALSSARSVAGSEHRASASRSIPSAEQPPHASAPTLSSSAPESPKRKPGRPKTKPRVDREASASEVEPQRRGPKPKGRGPSKNYAPSVRNEEEKTPPRRGRGRSRKNAKQLTAQGLTKIFKQRPDALDTVEHLTLGSSLGPTLAAIIPQCPNLQTVVAGQASFVPKRLHCLASLAKLSCIKLYRCEFSCYSYSSSVNVFDELFSVNFADSATLEELVLCDAYFKLPGLASPLASLRTWSCSVDRLPVSLKRLQLSGLEGRARASKQRLRGLERLQQLECLIVTPPADGASRHGYETSDGYACYWEVDRLHNLTELCLSYVSLNSYESEFFPGLPKLAVLFVHSLTYSAVCLRDLIAARPALRILVITGELPLHHLVGDAHVPKPITSRRQGASAAVSPLHIFLGEHIATPVQFEQLPADIIVRHIEGPLAEFLEREDVAPIFQNVWIAEQIKEAAKHRAPFVT